MYVNDTVEKQESAFEYRRKKLCRQNDIYLKVGISLILLSFITFFVILTIFLPSAALPDFAAAIFCGFLVSIPIAIVYSIIVNEKFKERIELERYRFCKVTKEKRGWVIH